MPTGYFCRYSLTQENGPTDELTVSGMGERGAYLEKGAIKTGKLIAIYKCNKVSKRYFTMNAMKQNSPPSELRALKMNYPENII